MSRRMDLTGQQFGRWTVVAPADNRRWQCRCTCGATRAVATGSLRYGDSRGCRSCASRETATTHGAKHTRLYKTWEAMKRRCSAPKCHGFARYGGRGIRVCPEWADSFAAFQLWALANGYADHLTIERNNNDGDYSPDNCRWATMVEQQRNRSTNQRVEYQGRMMLVGELAAEVGLTTAALRQRLFKHHWPLDRAISQPLTLRPGRLSNRLQAESPTIARELEAALKGKAKNFRDRERAR